MSLHPTCLGWSSFPSIHNHEWSRRLWRDGLCYDRIYDTLNIPIPQKSSLRFSFQHLLPFVACVISLVFAANTDYKFGP